MLHTLKKGALSTRAREEKEGYFGSKNVAEMSRERGGKISQYYQLQLQRLINFGIYPRNPLYRSDIAFSYHSTNKLCFLPLGYLNTPISSIR